MPKTETGSKRQNASSFLVLKYVEIRFPKVISRIRVITTQETNHQ